MANNDDFHSLAEIVDALINKLARDRPNDETLRSIAQRARNLYRKSVGDRDGNDKRR
jgi:hypothetical protein